MIMVIMADSYTSNNDDDMILNESIMNRNQKTRRAKNKNTHYSLHRLSDSMYTLGVFYIQNYARDFYRNMEVQKGHRDHVRA